MSNAVEKVCKENGFKHIGTWSKWGSYGFNEGKLQYEEYYPNALEDTYKGVSGYIYSCARITEKDNFELNIPNAYVSQECVEVLGCEFIEDAYVELLDAANKGLIRIVRYNEFITKHEQWLKKIIIEEYEGAIEHPEYRFFLEKKFNHILEY